MEKEDREFMDQMMELRAELEKHNAANKSQGRGQLALWVSIYLLMIINLALQLYALGFL